MAKNEDKGMRESGQRSRDDGDIESASEAIRRRRERLESTLRMLNGKRTVIVLESELGTQVRVQGLLRYEKQPTDGITEDDTRVEFLFSKYAVVKFA